MRLFFVVWLLPMLMLIAGCGNEVKSAPKVASQHPGPTQTMGRASQTKTQFDN
jgi:hypothetical protein